MKIELEHTTNYKYKNPIRGLIQTTKLYPSSHNGLEILEWEVNRDIGNKSKIYIDAEANHIQNYTNNNKINSIKFVVKGIVETKDTKGIYYNSLDKINPIVYLRNTYLTKSDNLINELALDACNNIKSNDKLSIAHNLLKLVSERVEYKPLTTSQETTAIVAYIQKRVCVKIKLIL